MPIYAYRCQSCGFAKDVLQKISDPVLVECPECHQPTFSKQLTAAGFHLKGTGWYVTDHKNPPQKAPAASSSSNTASSDSGSASASGSGSSGDSKAESGAGSKSSSSEKAA